MPTNTGKLKNVGHECPTYNVAAGLGFGFQTAFAGSLKRWF